MQPRPMAETSRSASLRFFITGPFERGSGCLLPRVWSPLSVPSGFDQRSLELIEASPPAGVLCVAPLVLRDAAVHQHHGGRAVGLRERELDQLLVGGIVAEGAAEDQPMGPVDLGVFA